MPPWVWSHGFFALRTVVSEIIDALNAGPVLWAGENPARQDMAAGNGLYDHTGDFRCPATFHQTFALVYLVERDLAAIKQWPLVLDEALRTLRPGGIIVIRLKENAILSIFQLANFIERWTGGQHELLDQVAAEGQFIISLRLTHSIKRSAAPTGWSFGIVTDGRKPGSVEAFVKSVLEIEGIEEDQKQILVCGPADATGALGPLSEYAVLVDQPAGFATRGWITRKKNLLVAASRHENVLIAHDRYTIPHDFLKQMETFGGDFDVVVPRQVTTAGAPLPDWVMIGDHLGWSVPGWMEYGDYHPLGFVNGGVMIAKRDRLIQTRWSEMLFWGQAEDVELSRRLENRGVVPRMARKIELLSEPPRAGFIDAFERLPWRDDIYVQTDRPDYGRPYLTGILGTSSTSLPPLQIDAPISLAGPKAWRALETRGLTLGAGWTPQMNGVVWSGAEAPRLSFKLVGAADAMVVSIVFADALAAEAIGELEINGERCPVTARWGAGIQVDIPTAMCIRGSMFHIRMIAMTAEPLVMQTFSVNRAGLTEGRDLISPIKFNAGSPATRWLGKGWHAPESWGVWTSEEEALVRIPALKEVGDHLNGTADLVADFKSDPRPQNVSILANGVLLGQGNLSPAQKQKRIQFRLPWSAASEVTLVIRTSHTHRGENGLIGVGLKRLSLTRGAK